MRYGFAWVSVFRGFSGIFLNILKDDGPKQTVLAEQDKLFFLFRPCQPKKKVFFLETNTQISMHAHARIPLPALD